MGNVATRISSLELHQDMSEQPPGHRLGARRWEAGAEGLRWESRRPLVSLHVPAVTSVSSCTGAGGAVSLGPAPGVCWKDGGNGLAPTVHLSLEVPVSPDTCHHPHTHAQVPQGWHGPECSSSCLLP